jgi:hypothetical protein
MTLEQVLTWGAIAGLYGWQFVHGRWCADWRVNIARELGVIRGKLRINDE